MSSARKSSSSKVIAMDSVRRMRLFNTILSQTIDTIDPSLFIEDWLSLIHLALQQYTARVPGSRLIFADERVVLHLCEGGPVITITRDILPRSTNG